MDLKPNKPAELYEKGKAWWESKTIWGIIIVLVPQVAKLIGIDVDVVVVENVEDTVQTLNLAWNDIISVVGAIVAWWGRVKARFKIGS